MSTQPQHPHQRLQAPTSRISSRGNQSRRVNRKLAWAGGLVAVLALIGASFLIGGTKAPAANAALKIGAAAPAFSGTNVITQLPVDSKTLAGKNVLYYFSEGSGCQACMVQIQALQQHMAHLTRQHLTLVSITNDDPSILLQAAAGYKISTEIVADPDRTMTRRFGALGGGMHADMASHTFILVDKSGTVRYVKDFPRMWIDPGALLKQLPTVN
jgi:peroxiredoxin